MGVENRLSRRTCGRAGARLLTTGPRRGCSRRGRCSPGRESEGSGGPLRRGLRPHANVGSAPAATWSLGRPGAGQSHSERRQQHPEDTVGLLTRVATLEHPGW